MLFVCGFGADMNLRAVLRKAKNGKLGGAGGYLAHVGVGIMLAGIVVSGVYARSLMEHGQDSTEQDIAWLDRLIQAERGRADTTRTRGGTKRREERREQPRPLRRKEHTT